MTRLYWLYNYGVGDYGKPFAMCDDCVKGYDVPGCLVIKLADNPAEEWPCAHPDHGKSNKTKGESKV